MALSREQIRSIADRKTTDVRVEGWPDAVRLRQLGADQRLEYMRRARAAAEKGDYDLELALWLIRESAVDEGGKSLFPDAEDEAWLRDRPLPVIMQISNAAAELNVLTAKSGETLEGK